MTARAPDAVTFETPITLRVAPPAIVILVGGPHGDRDFQGDPLRWVDVAVTLVDNLVGAGLLARDPDDERDVATTAVVLLASAGYMAWGGSAHADATARLEGTGARVVQVSGLAALRDVLGPVAPGAPRGRIEGFHYVGYAAERVWRAGLLVDRPSLLLSPGWPAGGFALFADELAANVAPERFHPDARSYFIAAGAARSPDADVSGSFCELWAKHTHNKQVWGPGEDLDLVQTSTEGTRLAQIPWKGEAIPAILDGLPILRRIRRLDRAAKGGAYTTQTASAEPTLEQTLKKKQGVHAHAFEGYFKGRNAPARRFMLALPAVVTFQNAALAADGRKARVNACELGTNFLTEGGNIAIDRGLTAHIDGYKFFGIDTLVNRYATLKRYLDADIQLMVDKKKGIKTQLNDGRVARSVTTLSDLTIEQGLKANAGMYAWSKGLFELDLAELGTDITTLAERVQVYWGTVYYNAGPGNGPGRPDGGGGSGHGRLQEPDGVGAHSRKWTLEDDPLAEHGVGKDRHQNQQDSHFNGSWRTVTYELLRRRVFHETILDETTLI